MELWYSLHTPGPAGALLSCCTRASHCTLADCGSGSVATGTYSTRALLVQYTSTTISHAISTKSGNCMHMPHVLR